MQPPVCISELCNAHCTWTFFPFQPKALRQAVRGDAGGADGPKNDRSLLTKDAELPPGVSLHNGHPKGASPFFQCFLPTGFLHERQSLQKGRQGPWKRQSPVCYRGAGSGGTHCRPVIILPLEN